MGDTFDVDALLEQLASAGTAVKDTGRSSKHSHRSEDRHHDRSERSERSERDRHRERDRDRDRDRDRERDRDRDRDRDRPRDRDRDRDRGRDRGRDRDYSDKYSSRDRYGVRERGYDRERPRESDRERRSRSSVERPREHPSSRSEGKDRVSNGRERRDQPEGDLRSSRAAPPPAPRPRKPRTPTPEREIRNMQRMSCTVMAYGLSVLAEEMDVFEFFSQAGELADVKLIRDKHSSRHKGIAYIEYNDRADVLNALQLNGKPLKGMPVNVKPSEAEKNFAWETQENQKRLNRQATDPVTAGMEAGGPTCIRVENLPTVGLTESDIRPIFEDWGSVLSIRFERDSSGQCTGVAFVQYPTAPEGRKAQYSLDGNTAFGPPLKITVLDTPSQFTPLQYPGELDEGDESGGVRLNASARTALMGKLSGAAEIERPKEPAYPVAPVRPAKPEPQVDAVVEADKGLVGSASPKPTQCLLLKNMFNPEQEEGAEWPQEIAADTKEECSKFGEVMHLHVDPASRGFVYVKFADDGAAVAAQKALHGRWYSHNQIIAVFQFTQLYNQHFGLV